MLRITEHGDSYIRPHELLIATICPEKPIYGFDHQPFTSISPDDGEGRPDTNRLIIQPFPGQPLVIEYIEESEAA